jgi:beta-galactosidase
VFTSSSQIELRAGEVRAVFDAATRELVQFGTAALNPILRGPQLQVWRGATDNDGIKLMMVEEGGDPWRNQQLKPLFYWVGLGLDHLQTRPAKVRLVEDAEFPTVEVVQEASGREEWDDFEHRAAFTLLPSGVLRVENTVLVSEDIVEVPRVGVVMALAPGLERLTWYGRGPWDDYPDRQASAMVGAYESSVRDQYVPYIMPQEHGLHTGVRWLELKGESGAGVRVTGEPQLMFSASHFTADDLYAAHHTCDLRPRAEVILSLDAAHRGLGTASCGPDTLAEYCLTDLCYSFSYRLSVVA